MRVSIHQPNYLPWIGYFRKISRSDIFIFYDDIQFEKGGYTNRVEFLISKNKTWLTQPIIKTSILNIHIKDILFANDIWRLKHQKSILINYSKAHFFHQVDNLLSEIFDTPLVHISDFNIRATTLICKFLNIDTKLLRSSELQYARDTKNPSLKLATLCLSVGADNYLSGNGGKNYNDHTLFSEHGVSVEYDNWRQPNFQFNNEHPVGLSIIDALANIGVDAVREIIMTDSP